MATFVLVHGATLGSWCWKRVIPLLRNLGHDVYAVTLTGLAERAHLLSPSINMETHIQDIVRLIDVEELTNVVLVGHSLGVDPATGAADRIPHRIAHLVYFDSLPTKNGESGFSSDNEEFKAWILNRVVESEQGLLFRPPDSRDFGLSDDVDINWVNAKMTPHPFNAWKDNLHLYHEEDLAHIPKSFIACIGDQLPGQPHRPGSENMHYYEMQSGHLAMINTPLELTSLLHRIATQPALD